MLITNHRSKEKKVLLFVNLRNLVKEEATKTIYIIKEIICNFAKQQ